MRRNEEYRFCPRCGGELERRQVKKGEPERLVCRRCGFVFYLDPKIAACTIIEVEGKIVLLRRAIHPALGSWVIPGGFVDLGETVPGAAVRETREEASVNVTLGPLVGIYSYPDVSVVIVVYEAVIVGGTPAAGDESSELGLFEPSGIPWQSLAFASTSDALRDYLKGRHPGTIHS
ncbi:MAG TPA: NUDIX hydrolase [Deltaproteobacteria bacterium]|nr:NUDIX hydrolase [Deltaproteobacteria bacterium]